MYGDTSFRQGTRRLSAGAAMLVAAVHLSPVGWAWAEVPRLEGEGFEETLLPELEVGGVYLVGLHHGPPMQEANPEEMFVWLPGNAGSTLCVTVRSIDGLYKASDRFTVENRSAGRYVVTFGAKKQEALERYGAGELVLDGRLGEDCSRPEELSHVPMAWTPDAPPGRLAFFINDDGHEGMLFVPLARDREEVREVACEDLESELPRRVFSTVCVLEDLTGLDLAQGWIEIRRYGRRMAWEALTLALPALESWP